MVYIDEKRIRAAFLEEVNELLDSLNQEFLSLENSPSNIDGINEIFRLTHSIKSESALVGFHNIAEISHKMEDLFEKIRNGVMVVDRHIIDSLFKSYDKIIEMVKRIQNDEDESSVDITEELKELSDILNASSELKKEYKEKTQIVESDIIDKITSKKSEQVKETDKVEVKEGVENILDVTFSDFEEGQIEDGLEKGEKIYKIVFYLSKECDMRYPRAFLVYNNFLSEGTVVKTIPDILYEAEDEKFKSMELYLLTNADVDRLRNCADVDQVDKVEVNLISNSALKAAGLDLSNLKGNEELALSDEEILEAERIEKEWKEQLAESSTSFQDLKEENVEDILSKEIEEKNGILTDTIDIQETDKSQKNIVKEALDRTIKRQTIRVDTDRLDTLMNLVGELIINHSRFVQLKNTIHEKSSLQEIQAELDDSSNELERISDMMQSSMMLVRMVPIGTIFSRFPRMIRDLANALQKNVALNITGESTEIDKAVVELIAEPLTHILRNAIDHGIEDPEERYKNGKAREGIIELRAYQQGSHMYIVISDDGKGLDVEKLKEVGINRNIITPQEALVMSDDEAYNLIFEPGFSTKGEITGLSGRGVGMDVVKNQIEKLRGHIEISSKIGKGTIFKIVLPLTLTIIEAMLVNVGENIFAIPVNEIEETLIIKKDEIRDFDDYKVYDLRNETLAILKLSELVGFESSNNSDEYFVVIVRYERRKIGLIVDELLGHQDIVIKALDESLKSLEGIAGATVLGDGKIALILEINSLVRERKMEINKLSESLDIFKNENVTFNEIYDKLNKDIKNKGVDELGNVVKASIEE